MDGFLVGWMQGEDAHKKQKPSGKDMEAAMKAAGHNRTVRACNTKYGNPGSESDLAETIAAIRSSSVSEATKKQRPAIAQSLVKRRQAGAAPHDEPREGLRHEQQHRAPAGRSFVLFLK